MFLLFGIYAIVGGVSAVTNFGKWLFSSSLICFLFLPFMIIHAFIYGDQKKKKEAIVILKGLVVVVVMYFSLVGVIFLFKG